SVTGVQTCALPICSIGPGALLDSRSESKVMACPDGLVATNFCSPIHFTDAVCMHPPARKNSRSGGRKGKLRTPAADCRGGAQIRTRPADHRRSIILTRRAL